MSTVFDRKELDGRTSKIIDQLENRYEQYCCSEFRKHDGLDPEVAHEERIKFESARDWFADATSRNHAPGPFLEDLDALVAWDLSNTRPHVRRAFGDGYLVFFTEPAKSDTPRNPDPIVDVVRRFHGCKPDTCFGVRFSLDFFNEQDAPVLFLHLPFLDTDVLIGADGSLALIEEGEFSSGFNGEWLEGENILADAAAQDDVVPFNTGRMGTDDTYVLLDATCGARLALGLSPDASLHEVAAAAKAAGGNAARINAQIEALGNEAGLFKEPDTRSWTDDEEVEVAETLIAILQSDPRFTGGRVCLDPRGLHTDARIDAPFSAAIASRVFGLLEATLDFSARFHGWKWWNAEDPISRADTWFPMSWPVFDQEVSSPSSSHERLRAVRVIREKLKDCSLVDADVEALLSTETLTGHAFNPFHPRLLEKKNRMTSIRMPDRLYWILPIAADNFRATGPYTIEETTGDDPDASFQNTCR